MALIKTIKDDITAALKAKETATLTTLRALLAELEKEKVTLKLASVEDLSNDQILTVITRVDKKLDKEKVTYQEVGQPTDKQDAEKAVLAKYLPAQLTDEEIETEVYHAVDLVDRQEIDIAGAKKYLAQKLKGKADMRKVMEVLDSVFNQN